MSKPVLFIGLGLIIPTDIQKSLEAIQGFLLKFQSKISIETLLSELSYKFQQFDKGYYQLCPIIVCPDNKSVLWDKISNFLTPQSANDLKVSDPVKDAETAFSKDLWVSLINHIKSEQQVEFTIGWIKQWRSLWNAQCTVTKEQAQTLHLLLSTTKFKVIIYAHTNLTHMRHIYSQLKPLNRSDVIDELYTHIANGEVLLSYIKRKASPLMLDRYLEENEVSLPYYVILGNNANIKPQHLQSRAVKTDLSIRDVCNGAEIFVLPDTQVNTRAFIENCLDDISKEAAPPSKARARSGLRFD